MDLSTLYSQNTVCLAAIVHLTFPNKIFYWSPLKLYVQSCTLQWTTYCHWLYHLLHLLHHQNDLYISKLCFFVRQYSRNVLWPQDTEWPKWSVVTGQLTELMVSWGLWITDELRPENNRWANRHKYIYCTAIIDWFAIVLMSTIMDSYWVLMALGSWPTMKDLFRSHLLEQPLNYLLKA